MKIGLCLSYKGTNYGMILQAYATQQVLHKLGYETEIIDYSRNGNRGVRFTPWLIFFFINKKIKEIRGKKITEFVDTIHENNISERRAAASQFVNEKLLNIIKLKGIDKLKKYTKMNYNGVLVGSDQLWLPNVAFSNFMTMRFVPDYINKISYATSLGVSEYPFYCKSSARQFLRRINHISVREQQGREIINNLCKELKVEVVVDPTYLLTQEEWLERIPPKRLIHDKYVLCYFLGATQEHKVLAQKFARKKGFKLVSILSTESNSNIDVSFADEIITGFGPDQFLNLIRGAEYVMTDSFHGLAFSVINQKQFYVFYRTKVGSVNSRNSRIDNILNEWELNSRLVLDEDTVNDFDNRPIDYKHVNEIVEKRRQESMQYLIKALEDCK